MLSLFLQGCLCFTMSLPKVQLMLIKGALIEFGNNEIVKIAFLAYIQKVVYLMNFESNIVLLLISYINFPLCVSWISCTCCTVHYFQSAIFVLAKLLLVISWYWTAREQTAQHGMSLTNLSKKAITSSCSPEWEAKTETRDTKVYGAFRRKLQITHYEHFSC